MAKRPKILLVGQERGDGDACMAGLRAAGLRVAQSDAARALLEVGKTPPDVVLIVSLPAAQPRGEYCRSLRATAGPAPMRLLVAIPERMEMLRTHCREQGADGFVEPPPTAQAVLAQIERSPPGRSEWRGRTLRHGAIEMRVDEAKLFLTGERLSLRPALFDLLRIFLENPDRMLSHEELIALTGRARVARPQLAVAERVRSLRESLAAAGVEDVVRTIGSRGYALGRAWPR